MRLFQPGSSEQSHEARTQTDFREPSLTEIQTQENPRLVFDSDFPSANKQYQQVLDNLKGLEHGEYTIGTTQVIINKKDSLLKTVVLSWDFTNTALILSYSAKLRGFQANYAYLQPNTNGNAKLKQIALNQFWGETPQKTVVVRPTIDRWVIRRTPRFDQNLNYVYDLYIGLGFLLLGPAWMHIGNHEIAGHLSGDTGDENEAWRLAHIWTRQLHEQQTDIFPTGIFGNLVKPDKKRDRKLQPTIGEIAMYGLVSHFIDNNARVPQHWKKRTDEINSELSELVALAQRYYFKLINSAKR